MSNKGNVDLGVTIDLFKLEDGTRIRLKDGRPGRIAANMNDGQWVEIDFDDDEVELIHGQDLDTVLPDSD